MKRKINKAERVARKLVKIDGDDVTVAGMLLAETGVKAAIIKRGVIGELATALRKADVK